MAITKTAKQNIRKSKINALYNDRRRRVMKETVKTVRTFIKKDVKAAEDALSQAFKALDKAAKRGVIKKNQASRKKSRLAIAIAKAKTTK